jgi:FkbM family methyltransferase
MVSTLYGHMRVIESDQVVSRSLSVYGEWAQDELALLRRLVPSEACVLDVGAFLGTHTLAFSRFVGPKGRVYAVEPRREIYTVLAENIAINACHNVTALNMGLGNIERSLNLPFVDLGTPENFGSLSLAECPPDPNSYEIQVSTIDGLGIGKIDMIKLDVEGMERQVLDGATLSVLQHRPVIFCECNSINSGAELLDFCHQHQYKAYAFLASAYNPDNFNEVRENIFGDSKELMLLLLPRPKDANELGTFFAERLHPINTLEDLVLPLLHKPQYAYEVLAYTGPGTSLGTRFPSPAIASYVEIITVRDKEVLSLRNEIGRIKATLSWKITGPLRFIWNVISRLGGRKL